MGLSPSLRRFWEASSVFTIGEFSMASGIPVRTLRFYHDEGLLVPAAIDTETKYRSYDEQNLERASVIVALRDLEFSLDDIREILADCRDDLGIVRHLKRQQESLMQKVKHYMGILQKISQLIENLNREREEEKMSAATYEIGERQLETMLVAGIRMQGHYSDCGQGFARLCRSLGRHMAGKPLCLFYDGEYREGDANFEPCVPIRKAVSMDGINVRELPAARCVTLIHRGSYDQLRSSYARLMRFVKDRGFDVQLPTREVYVKGPGMIFRGNPKKYLTEIQLPIAS
jgi:DNA-binding transcriptional MerR regulator/effector-binding domain-containing protein